MTIVVVVKNALGGRFLKTSAVVTNAITIVKQDAAARDVIGGNSGQTDVALKTKIAVVVVATKPEDLFEKLKDAKPFGLASFLT